MSLFSPVTYHLASSLLPSVSSQLDTLLLMNGATRAVGGVGDEGLTHVVAESVKFEGWEQVVRRAGKGEGDERDEDGGEGKDVHGRMVHVVTPKWVERSAVLGKLQPEQFFSADPSMLFSGICACSTDLPSSDLEVLSAGITALGGQWRVSLTKEVTHLFALSPDSPKYSTAIHYKAETGVKVLLPHWFDDVVRLGMRGLSESVYEWPEVRLLKGVEGLEPMDRGKENVPANEVQSEKERVKRNMYATAHLFTQPMNASSPPTEKDINLVTASASTPTNHKQLPPSSSAHSNGNASTISAVGVGAAADGTAPGIQHQVWAGRKVLLSRTLQLYHGRHTAVRLNIERAGGVVLRYKGDDEEQEAVRVEAKVEGRGEGGGGKERLGGKEKARRRREAEMVQDCDVLVTRWRFGRAYVQAVRQAKTIGTLAWLFHVQSTGVFSRPLDQLLHFPLPKRPIENFGDHVITVTNYTGEAREYLKKLIMAMGATFTPSMSGQNTALVAAYIHGTKASKALSWSIPVVNHTWLEDCFIQWRNLTPANIKYIHFPPGVDFSKILGERGLHTGGDLATEGQEKGKGKEGVMVNGFKHDINMGGVGPSTREEVMGRIESEAEELAEMGDDLSDVDEEEEEEELELQAPNGTEASMKEVAGLVSVDGTVVEVDRHAPMDLDLERSPVVSAAALGAFETGDELMDFEDQLQHAPDEEMEVEVEERVKSPVKPKSTSKSKSPTKPKSRSAAARDSPAKPIFSTSPSKPPATTTSKVNGKTSAKFNAKSKAISVSDLSSAEEELQPAPAQDVFELEGSSEEEERRAKAKEKAKQKMKPRMKPVVEMVIRSTPKGKEKTPAAVSASKSNSKSAEKERENTKTQSRSKKRMTTSEYEDGDEEDEDDVQSPSPPVQSVSPRKNKATPKSNKSNGKAKGKEKGKRSRMTSSSEEDGDENENEGMEPPPPRQTLLRRGQKLSSPSPQQEEEEEALTPPPPPSRRKEKKQDLTKKKVVRRVDVEDEVDDEDSVAVVPVKKASVSPAKPLSAATATTSAGKGGLMNKAKGDARTRMKKKNKEKEPEVGFESESEEEDDDGDDVVVVSRKKTVKKGRDEKEEEGASPPPKKSTAKSSSEPHPTSKSKSKPTGDDDEPQQVQARKGRSRPLRVYDDEAEDDEEEEEEAALPPPADSDDSDELPAAPLQKSKAEKRVEETKKGKGKEKASASISTSKAGATTSAKGKGKRAATPTDTEPEEEEPPRKTNATTATATKQPPTTPKRVMSVLLPSLELSPEKAKAVKKAMHEVNAKAKERKEEVVVGNMKGKAKGKDRKVVSEDEEEEPDELESSKPKRGRQPKKDKDASTSAPPKSKALSKAKTVTTSRRHASSVESEDEDEEEEEEVTGIVSPRAARALTRTESVRAVAGQVPAATATATPSKAFKTKKGAVNGTSVNATASTSKAVVASVTASTSVKPKPKAKSKRDQDTPMEVDQSASASVADDSSISVAPPRRSAAAKATQKLHDTIMPDLLQYEAQRKKAGKSASSYAFAMDGDDMNTEKGHNKRASQDKEVGEVEKPKKKRRVSGADSDDEVQVPSKPSKSKGRGKPKVTEDDVMDVDSDGKGLTGEGIVIMTTQVSLRDDVVKALNKLGVKITTRPNECTHLIASNLVRTEKFLCALASRAPWIVTEGWAVQSAEAKKILPEKDFVLKDKAGENKYGISLTESLKRSKALGGKLLAGHTFYVTPKVPVDTKLLKNVLTACGGQLTTQSPTVRIINAAPTTRHVISCKEDIAIWRPLAAQGIKIYTQELVLTGALAQEMHWDRGDFLVLN